MNTQNRKSWRHKILAGRDRLSPVELVEKSGRITQKLFSLAEVRSAHIFFIYLYFRSEVRTLDIVRQCLAEGKTVTVPLTVANESRLLAVRITDPQNQLEPGYCTIPEPVPSLVPKSVVEPAKIDVVIVPGSVFDRFGGRLGYGGGAIMTVFSTRRLQVLFASDWPMNSNWWTRFLLNPMTSLWISL